MSPGKGYIAFSVPVAPLIDYSDLTDLSDTLTTHINQLTYSVVGHSLAVGFSGELANASLQFSTSALLDDPSVLRVPGSPFPADSVCDPSATSGDIYYLRLESANPA